MTSLRDCLVVEDVRLNNYNFARIVSTNMMHTAAACTYIILGININILGICVEVKFLLGRCRCITSSPFVFLYQGNPDMLDYRIGLDINET